jgi:hypothetical protein
LIQSIAQIVQEPKPSKKKAKGKLRDELELAKTAIREGKQNIKGGGGAKVSEA